MPAPGLAGWFGLVQWTTTIIRSKTICRCDQPAAIPPGNCHSDELLAPTMGPDLQAIWIAYVQLSRRIAVPFSFDGEAKNRIEAMRRGSCVADDSPSC
jgi:hypothetical protein